MSKYMSGEHTAGEVFMAELKKPPRSIQTLWKFWQHKRLWNRLCSLGFSA